MTTIVRNIAANYVGSVVPALLSLLLIPFYISRIGIEGYALVGIFATLQALFAPLDAGLSVVMTRELALRSVTPGSVSRSRALVHTAERLYWAMAVVIGISVSALSPLIATHWIRDSHIPVAQLTRALMLIGVTSMMQWPLSFYSGALYGLQRQVTANAINITAAVLNGIGSVLVLTMIGPSVEVFFAWQAIAYALYTGAMYAAVWMALPAGQEAFDALELRTIWCFAAGTTMVTLLAVVLTQIDKLVLSRLLSLRLFGYYTLAGVVAASLYRLVGPLSQALFPHFAALVALGDSERLEHVYHRACQLMSVMVFPIAVVISLFSYDVLLVWTRDAATAGSTAATLSVLIAGTMLHATVFLPYQLQLAYGWTSLAIYSNIVAVLVIVPLTVVLATQFGGVGAALAWVTLNVGYVTISIPVMHTRLLPRAKWPWYARDVFLPLAATVVVVGAGRLLVPSGLSTIPAILLVSTVAAAALVSAVMTAGEIRRWVAATLKRAFV